jgi:hypothetical protein
MSAVRAMISWPFSNECGHRASIAADNVISSIPGGQSCWAYLQMVSMPQGRGPHTARLPKQPCYFPVIVQARSFPGTLTLGLKEAASYREKRVTLLRAPSTASSRSAYSPRTGSSCRAHCQSKPAGLL